MHNNTPALLGTVTVFGIVINNQYVMLATLIVIMLTCVVVMINIIRNCDARNKRLARLQDRRNARYATPDTTAA